MMSEGEDDIVTALCDFMLQQKSPKAETESEPRVEMGGSVYKPFFSPLVALASRLVRCMRTSTTTDDSSTFSKMAKTDLETIDPATDMPAIAVEYFSNKDLFKLIMAEGYAVKRYSKALAHVCWGNQALSR